MTAGKMVEKITVVYLKVRRGELNCRRWIETVRELIKARDISDVGARGS